MIKIPYLSVVGSLIYAMICTRHDITYAVSLVSRYQLDPSSLYQQVVKRIFKYLKGTPQYSLSHRSVDLKLIGSRVLIGLTIWRIVLLLLSIFSYYVALSTMKVEFLVAANAVKEDVWLGHFLHHLGDTSSSLHLLTIFCDNQAALVYTKDLKFHSKTTLISSLTLLETQQRIMK